MGGIVELSGDGEAGFRVRLDPPDANHPPEGFYCYRAARGAAGGLRLVLGCRLVDLAKSA